MKVVLEICNVAEENEFCVWLRINKLKGTYNQNRVWEEGFYFIFLFLVTAVVLKVQACEERIRKELLGYPFSLNTVYFENLCHIGYSLHCTRIVYFTSTTSKLLLLIWVYENYKKQKWKTENFYVLVGNDEKLRNTFLHSLHVHKHEHNVHNMLVLIST